MLRVYVSVCVLPSPLHPFTSSHTLYLLPSLPPPAVCLSLSFTLSLFHSLPVSISLPCAAALHQPVSKSVVRGIESGKLYVADVQLNADLHYCMHPLTSPPPSTLHWSVRELCSGVCMQRAPAWVKLYAETLSPFHPTLSGPQAVHYRISKLHLSSSHHPIVRGQRARWSFGGLAGAVSRERTFCACEMQHSFPPAEHKQPAEWLVGPHSLEVLIGFCVSWEMG